MPGRKVKKTLNIDAEKLKRVQKWLGAETETEVIDRLLDEADVDARLLEILKAASPHWKTFRSPLTSRPPRGRRS